MGKRTVITETDDPKEPPRVIVEKTHNPNADTFEAFKSRFRDSKTATVRVHRQVPEGREYCFTDRAEAMDGPESLRRWHSSQPFAGQSGVYEIDLEIDGEIHHVPQPIRIAPQIREAGSGMPVNLDNNQAFTGGMASLVLEQVRQSNENVVKLLTAERTPMLEMVHALSEMQKMMQSQNPTGLGSPDNILKWIDVGKAIAGGQGEGWGGVVRDVVRDAIPALAPALPGIIAHLKAPAPAPAAAIPPNAVPVNVAPVAPATDVPEPKVEKPMEPIETEDEMLLKQVFEFLKSKARRNSDPSIYVDFLVDNQDNPVYDKLLSRIVAPQSSFDQFVAIDAEIGQNPYRQWFEFIYNGVRSVLGVTDPVDVHPSGASGNNGDTARDGKPGKKRG